MGTRVRHSLLGIFGRIHQADQLPEILKRVRQLALSLTVGFGHRHVVVTSSPSSMCARTGPERRAASFRKRYGEGKWHQGFPVCEIYSGECGKMIGSFVTLPESGGRVKTRIGGRDCHRKHVEDG
ncbi:hypothetical protein SAY87_005560 [Trapa incisa]|uniref:Uncharacterized protein n=1 Tax=Trapa incisa TaxID=236973 RepID=A0AAN7Q750_9MYRT|nr:hypothetical protein SAY87_005560 [Trapa incisa]